MAPTKKRSIEEKKLQKKLRDKLRYEKNKADPEVARLMKLKEQEKYRKKKEKGQVKLVAQMSNREKRAKRKQWKDNTRAYRKRKKDTSQYQTEDNPSLVVVQPQLPTPPAPQKPHQISSGRKKIRKDRSKVVRENRTLRKENALLRRKVDSQRKKIDRLNQPMATTTDSESPGKVVNKIMKENNPSEVRKRLLFGEVLGKQLTDNLRKVKSRQIKRDIAQVLIGNGKRLKKYGLLHKCDIFIPSSSRQWKNSPNDKLTRCIIKKIQEDVINFLQEDENSRCCPGKKECITKKGLKKQKRLLLGDLKDIHKKFIKSSSYRLSYSSFCRLRPFWIIVPNVAKRNTCLCQTHENFQLRLEALFRRKVIESPKANMIVYQLCCVPPTVNCFHRKCETCKNNNIQYIGEFDGSEIMSVKQWRTTKVQYKDIKSKLMKQSNRIVKVTLQKSLIDLIRETEDSIDSFLRHEGNIYHQHNAIKYLKTNLREDEVLIHCDFSENYLTKHSSEIQAIHFGGNRQSLSLHSVVLYYRKNNLSPVSPVTFCTISENLDHGAGAIWAHLQPIFSYIKSLVGKVTRLHVLSDGPSSQYRNKSIFYLLQYRLIEIFPFLKLATWNYQEAGHGKGAPDGVGGTIKRTADRLVAQGNDITNVDTMMEAISRKIKNINLYVIESSSIKGINDSITASDIRPFRGTMHVHQVVWKKGAETLQMNKLSCFFCPYNCKDHKIGAHVSARRLEKNEETLLQDFEIIPQTCLNEQQPHLEDVENPFRDFALPQQPLEVTNNDNCQFLLDQIGGRNENPECERGMQESCCGNSPNVTTEEFDVDINLNERSSYTLGLCYDCGGAITLKKRGVSCDICDKIRYHVDCANAHVLSLGPAMILVCQNCDNY